MNKNKKHVLNTIFENKSKPVSKPVLITKETQMTPIFENKSTKETQVSPIFVENSKPVTQVSQISIEKPVEIIAQPKLIETIKETSEIVKPKLVMSPIVKKPLIIKSYTFLKLKLWIWGLIVLLIIGIVIIILWVAGVFNEKPLDICKSYNDSMLSLTQAYNEQKKIQDEIKQIENNKKDLENQISEVNKLINISGNNDELNKQIAQYVVEITKLTTELNGINGINDNNKKKLNDNTIKITNLNNFLEEAKSNLEIEKKINGDMTNIDKNYKAAETCQTVITKNNETLVTLNKELKDKQMELDDKLKSIYPLSCEDNISILNWVIPIIVITVLCGILYFILKKSSKIKDEVAGVSQNNPSTPAPSSISASTPAPSTSISASTPAPSTSSTSISASTSPPPNNLNLSPTPVAVDNSTPAPISTSKINV